MARDSQRFRKIYSFYRPVPRPEEEGVTMDVIRSLDWKQSVRAATTGAITIASPGVIDGITLANEDRVLVKDQGGPGVPHVNNGIYYFDSSTGGLTRDVDATTSYLTAGAAVFVEEGATHADCAFVLTTNDPIEVGTTPLAWTKFAGPGSSIFVATTGSAPLYAKTEYYVSFDSASAGPRYTSAIGSDVFFFVSGSISGSGVNVKRAVFGGDVRVSGSIALGEFTKANGKYSHAEGYYSIANGLNSHAEGFASTADGQASHAEGYSTTATGDYSHAEGDSTIAKGSNSHVEGYLSVAYAGYSHAEGLSTIASGNYQHVEGKYNKRNNSHSLLVVGDGTGDSDAARSDILRVNPGPAGGQGSIQVTGSLYVSGTTTFDSLGRRASNIGSDVYFFVSGSSGSLGGIVPGVASFGGDLQVSGALKVGTGSITISEEYVQFGSDGQVKIRRVGSDLKLFDATNPAGLTLSDLDSGVGGSSGPTFFSSSTAGSIFTTGSVAFVGGQAGVDSPSDIGTDVFFYVSGAIDLYESYAVFGGDVWMSGTVFNASASTYASNNTHSVVANVGVYPSSTPVDVYVKAGDYNYVFMGEGTSPRAGSIILSPGGPTGIGSSARAGAIVVGANDLSSVGQDTFVWVGGTPGGRNGISPSNATFGGDIVSSGSIYALSGFSGSLTRLQNGTSYLVAGNNVTITSASNGAVTITGKAQTPLVFTKFNTDSSFGMTSPVYGVVARMPASGTVTGVSFTAMGTVTGSAVNYATFSVNRLPSPWGGTSQTTLAKLTITSSTQNMSTLVPKDLELLSTSFSADDLIIFRIDKTAAGMDIPSGSLVIQYNT